MHEQKTLPKRSIMHHCTIGGDRYTNSGVSKYKRINYLIGNKKVVDRSEIKKVL